MGIANEIAKTVLSRINSDTCVITSSGFFRPRPVFLLYHQLAEELFPGNWPGELREQALKSLEMILEEKVPDKIKSTSVLLQGSEAEEIARYAEESNISVIVMGTHGFYRLEASYTWFCPQKKLFVSPHAPS